MTINKIIKGITVFLFVFLSGFILSYDQINTLDVKAADIPVDNAPKGLNFDDYFTRGTFKGNGANTNFKNGDTSIIQVTPKEGMSIGGVWSNDKANNYINLNVKQTLSMWMYFGYESDPADGLAFVLQNSGYGAISMDGALPAKGQTMGVWGIDKDPFSGSGQTLADKAIQNSWAMEFDTHMNPNRNHSSLFSNGGWSGSLTGVNNGFDGGFSTEATSHIGDNYPGEASSYVGLPASIYQIPNQGTMKTVYIYQLLHRNLKTQSSKGDLRLSNGLWHHLVITWTPADPGSTVGHLTYELDGKIHTGEVTAGNNSQPVKVADIPIDTSNFYKNPTQQFSQNEGKVLWGFTGSTGDQYARNMVVFESIPSIVEGTVGTHIYNISQGGKELTSTDKSVYNHDQLHFVYNVKRDSGAMDWQNILASINLPDNMIYINGTIIYSDGTSENITSNELRVSPLKRTLKNLLKDKDPNSATITLNGVANSLNPKVDTDVAATDVAFTGDNLIKYTQLQDFVIKRAGMLLDGGNLNLDIGDAASVDATGKIWYDDTSINVVNSDLTVHYSLNGNNEVTTGMGSDTNAVMKLTIPRTSLNDGKNTLMVYVTDKSGNRTNYVTYTITKPTSAPILIDADKLMYFRTVRSNGKNQTVPRQGNWKLDIVDNAVDTSKWILTATAKQPDTSAKFDGDLVYVDDAGISKSILNGSIIEIANKSTFPSNNIIDGSTFQVANTWTENDGILLKANSTAKAGNYEYTITWGLTDSVR